MPSSKQLKPTAEALAREMRRLAPVIPLTTLSTEIRHAIVLLYGVVPVSARNEYLMRPNFGSA